jgi:hypothetical protein
MTPRPEALRLSIDSHGKRPPPPFGLAGWSANAAGTGIVLDATDADLSQVEAVAAQIPSAAALPPRSPLVIYGIATRSTSWWRRLFGPRHLTVTRAVRCAAMLTRGYVDIGGGVDQSSGADLAWGWSPQA